MALTYKVRCTCERTLVVGEKWFGKEIRCPHCQSAIKVPKAKVPGAAKPGAEPAQPEPKTNAAAAAQTAAPKQPTADAPKPAGAAAPASLKLKCACNRVLVVGAKFFGKKIRCPHCQRAVAVPTPKAHKAPRLDSGEEAKPPAEKEPEQEGRTDQADSAAKPEPAPPKEAESGSSLVGDVDGLKIEFEAPAEMAVSREDSVGDFGDLDPALKLEAEQYASAESEAEDQQETASAAPDQPPGEQAEDKAQPTVELDTEGPTECPHCRYELPPGSVFCVNCGTDLKTGRKLRRARAEGTKSKVKYEYDPPEEGACRFCEKEGVQVVQVSRSEIVKSRRFLKVLGKELDTKKPSQQELDDAAAAKMGDGEDIPVCEPCGKQLKIGPGKFAALEKKAKKKEAVEKEEEGSEEGQEDEEEKEEKTEEKAEETGEEAAGSASEQEAKPGLFGRLFGKKKAKSGTGE